MLLEGQIDPEVNINTTCGQVSAGTHMFHQQWHMPRRGQNN